MFWGSAKRVLRYFKDTAEYERAHVKYVDGDCSWTDDRSSFVEIISWDLRKQSTMEPEHMALS